MTFPVAPNPEVLSRGHTFASFDSKVCSLIFTCLHEDFEAFVSKGLDPNYTLQEDVFLENMVFVKGSSLLYVILQCCTITKSPWDLCAMMKLLLDQGADVKKSLRPEGGGKAMS